VEVSLKEQEKDFIYGPKIILSLPICALTLNNDFTQLDDPELSILAKLYSKISLLTKVWVCWAI
jgi:hypothetical protein